MEDEMEYVGLSEEMIEMLSVTPAQDTQEPYWKAMRVEVQPQTNNTSAFVVTEPRAPSVRFFWADGEHMAEPKDDIYAPEGARHNAASMPMFGVWGSYSVEIPGNSEQLRGFGLYGDNLDVTHAANHPVIITFKLIEPEEEEPPPPEKYTLKSGLDKWLGPESWEDLREAMKKLSTPEQWALVKERPGSFSDIDTIIVHHSGSDEPQTPEGIAKYHIGKGWGTISYHFLLGEDRVYFTAPVKLITHHAGSKHNPSSIGICVMGDYSAREPTEKQVALLRNLIFALWEFLGQDWDKFRITYLVTHGHLMATACPGKVRRSLVWDSLWPFPKGDL
jgi:hypothetical protein